MEPADIDWNNVDSRYIPDELYEHINAPKWLDLSSPDSSLSSIDDDAWFCRPDCRHPKTYEDFQKLSPSPRMAMLRSKRSSPAAMPLGERKSSNSKRVADNGNSLKRRGAILSLLLPADSPEPAKKGNAKKFREDVENQDPNTNSAASNRAVPMKVAKEGIKSSAEKGAKVVVNEERERQPVRRLRSTMSARNLFSGKDILGQISEFCNEIKKLAVGREKSSAAAKVVVQEVEEEEREVLVDKSNSKGDDGPVKNRGEKQSVLKEARAWPPTPQKIPSPSSRRLRSTKPASSGTTSSPLNKPPKSAPKERGILQELEQSREEKRLLVSKDDECNQAAAAAAGSEGSSMDMFWFLKPCTYLV